MTLPELGGTQIKRFLFMTPLAHYYIKFLHNNDDNNNDWFYVAHYHCLS